MHIAIDPLPCGKISRAAFIGIICLKVQRDSKDGDNFRRSEISRKYGIPQNDHYERDWSLMFTVKTPGEMCIAPRG